MKCTYNFLLFYRNEETIAYGSSQLRNAAQGQYFSLMVPDDIFEEIAVQTNLFAEQRQRSVKPSSRSHKWKPTTKDEVKRFFGLILYMGLVKLPKISLYWSTDRVYRQHFPPTVMSRNRICTLQITKQLILKIEFVKYDLTSTN